MGRFRHFRGLGRGRTSGGDMEVSVGLTLARRIGETIVIGSGIRVTVQAIGDAAVRLSASLAGEAPHEYPPLRIGACLVLRPGVSVRVNRLNMVSHEQVWLDVTAPRDVPVDRAEVRTSKLLTIHGSDRRLA